MKNCVLSEKREDIFKLLKSIGVPQVVYTFYEESLPAGIEAVLESSDDE